MQKNNQFEIELIDLANLILADHDVFLNACTCIEQVSKYIDTFILLKNECLEALYTIARKGKSDIDRIKAIELISKIEGLEALTQTYTKGNDINYITPEEVAKFIKEVQKIIQNKLTD